MGGAISRTDSGFRPLLQGHGDFTLVFEESIFTTAPAAIAIAAAIAQMISIANESRLVRSGALLGVKLLLGLLLAAAHLATLVLWVYLPTVRTQMTLPAAGLAFGGSVFIISFLVIEHFFSHRPSTFLSLFMSVTLLLDIAKTYSCYNRIGLGPVCAMYILSCVGRFLVLCSQEVSKRRLLRDESLKQTMNHESASGFWNRSLFLWLNSTLFLGFRKVLRVEDLPLLAPEFRSEAVFAMFKPQWDRVNKKSKYALVRACVLSQAIPFITITIPRCCLIGFTFAQPFLILRTTSAVGEEELPKSTSNGLIGATVLVYFGIAISQGYATHLAYQVTTCIRGMLTVAIYNKMFRLSYDTLMESTAETLMSTDLSGIETLVPLFHDMWAAVIELGFGLAILGSITGPACLLFLVPGIITTGGTSIVTKYMIGARAEWNEAIEDRVAKTSNIIAQLKVIKMAGLSEPIMGLVERLRMAEIKTSMRERNLRVVVGALNAFSRALAPVIVVAGALYGTRAGDGLSPNQIYTILAVVAIVSKPLMTILVSAPNMAGAFASFPRIQRFLSLEEQTDHRSTGDSYTSVRAANMSINSEYSRQLLQDVNLNLAPGSVSMFTGPVGCGKSALLKTLIGEVQIQTGFVEAPACPVGYSDQVAWLENISIRDNICHGDFNASRYNAVVSACALGPDLEALPNGEDTLVGSNGSNLSGGQRQRVALARAAYLEAAVVVLDDPLSAVDATTSAAIVQSLLGENGLLRTRNTTVIMTTSSRDLCSVADSVFTVNNEGKVQRLPGLARDPKRRRSMRELVSAKQDDEKASTSFVETTPTPPPTIPAPVEADDDNDDEENIRKGDRTLYTYYLNSVGWPLLTLSLCFIVVSSVADRMPAIYLRISLEEDPDSDDYFAGYAALGAAKVVLAIISLKLYFRNVFAVTSAVLHNRVLKTTIGATLSFISEVDSGSILNRFSQDMNLIAQRLPIVFLNAFYCTITVTLEIGIISAGARYVAATVPVIILVVIVLQHFYLRTSRQLRVRELEARAPLFTKFTETAKGIQHIRAFHWQESFTSQLCELLDHAQIPYYNLFCVQRWLTLVLDLTVCALAATLVALSMRYRASTSENAVGLSMLSVVTFSSSLAQLVQSWVELEISLGAIARIKNFCFGTPQEQDDGADEAIPDLWPNTGSIVFRGVSASYRKLNGSSHEVLNNVSFWIGDGGKLGLSGRTGSGKSSVMAVLLKMIDYSGNIFIDGRELRTIPREVVRSRIVTLTQDSVQLKGTLRLNLDPYHPSGAEGSSRLSDQEMITALTRVGLWDRVRNFGGLDADMIASSFSSGQQQLLAIARAMLRKSYTQPKIVLLDEATGSIDNDTDREIQALIADVFSDCTVVMISHRLYAFDRMRKVIMLSAGMVEDTLVRDPTTGLLVEA